MQFERGCVWGFMKFYLAHHTKTVSQSSLVKEFLGSHVFMKTVLTCGKGPHTHEEVAFQGYNSNYLG